MNTNKTLPCFLIVVLTLLIVGFIFIYSASSIFALEKLGSAQGYAKKQILGLGIGFLGLIFFSLLPIKNSKK